MRFKEIRAELTSLLKDFGPPRKSYHPEYPFWHLQSDGLWEIPSADHLPRRLNKDQATAAILEKVNAFGGFPEGVYEAFRQSPGLLETAVARLLSNSFPDSYHQEILERVSLALVHVFGGQSKRDPRFRAEVLRAYEYRCAVCGVEILLGKETLGLEAAHIRWRQARGPDEVQNGLALCVMHHHLFDRGAFTLDEERRILVSEEVRGGMGARQWLLDFHGHNVHAPQRPEYSPAQEHCSWHNREVFRKPPRDIVAVCRAADSLSP